MKKKKKKKKRKPRSTAGSRARVSTRRIPGPGDDGMAAAPRGARARAAAPSFGARAAAAPLPTRAAARVPRAAAGRDTITVSFELVDVHGNPAVDPATFFTFRRVNDNRQLGDQLELPLTGAPVTFRLPAGDGVGICEIDPQRFRFVNSPMFFMSPGQQVHKVVAVLREPQEWVPRFTRWRDLPPVFDSLKAILAASPTITLFRELAPIGELLVEDAYDGMSGDAVALAKASLLNICFRLRVLREPVSTDPWLAFVRRVIAIGRERILAYVDPAMEDRIQDIHQNIDRFRGEWERTPAENHRGNVPALLQGRISRMLSIKSAHDKGNVQLTIAHLTGPDEVLFDADIDESGDLFGHFIDLFKHKFNGGTHPHDIHELLVVQEGKTEGFDLGYRLV